MPPADLLAAGRTAVKSYGVDAVVSEARGRRSEKADVQLSACRLGMCERRGRAAADDGWGFVNQFVVYQGLDHEEREVDPTGQVAGEDRIADVATPDG